MKYKEVFSGLTSDRAKKVLPGIIVGVIPPLTTCWSYVYEIKIPLIFLWVALVVFFAFLSFMIVSVFIRKMKLRDSFHSIRYCFAFSIITTCCLGVIIKLQIQDQQKLRDEISSLMISEQESLFSLDSIKRMNGVECFFLKDYHNAIIQLKNHSTDPVAQYYYGFMLYNGVGIQRDERTGLELIRKSAEKKFFRAMAFMVRWGCNCGRIDEIVPYAEMLVHSFPDSMSSLRYEENINKFAGEQFLKLFEYCQESYRYMLIYNMFIRKSYYNLWCLINDYDYALRIFNNQSDNYLYYEESARDNAWGIWRLESKLIGRLFMWINAYVRFPNSEDAHLEYALMLVGQPNVRVIDYENIPLKNVSLSNLHKAEKELDKALGIAIVNNHTSTQCNILQLLANILRYTDRVDDADKLSIIIANLKLKKYYETIGN